MAKRRTANHPCPVCGKHYVNEGSLRKHLACHPETAQYAQLRMWPCSVCQAVFTHESGESRTYIGGPRIRCCQLDDRSRNGLKFKLHLVFDWNPCRCGSPSVSSKPIIRFNLNLDCKFLIQTLRSHDRRVSICLANCILKRYSLVNALLHTPTTAVILTSRLIVPQVF